MPICTHCQNWTRDDPCETCAVRSSRIMPHSDIADQKTIRNILYFIRHAPIFWEKTYHEHNMQGLIIGVEVDRKAEEITFTFKDDQGEKLGILKISGDSKGSFTWGGFC